MQISKSVNIFVSTWKWYVEGFTLKHLLRFEIRARDICENYVYKHTGKLLENSEDYESQIFRLLFSYEHKHIGRFSNLHECTFNVKQKFQSQNYGFIKFKQVRSMEVHTIPDSYKRKNKLTLTVTPRCTT